MSPPRARPAARELLIACTLASALASCAHRPSTLPAPAPAPVAPPPAPAAASPAPARPAPHRPPRGVVADEDKPPWMRELSAPDLPMRWYPRVSEYLERYRNEPRSHEIVRGWLRRLAAHRGPMEAALVHEGLPRAL